MTLGICAFFTATLDRSIKDVSHYCIPKYTLLRAIPKELRKLQKRKGFTLIELLVVIAIIAILAAILFPVFQKVRENARRTSCASNEKQIGIAFTQYEQDADELTPGSTQWGYGWAEKIMPFVKAKGVFQCPDDGHTVAPTVAPSTNPNTPISYALNGMIRQNCNNNLCKGASLALFAGPSNTVLCFESAHNGHRAVNQSGDINDPNWDARTTAAGVALDVCSHIGYDSQDGNDAHPAIGDTYQGIPNESWHDKDSGSLNWLAVDGHVKYLKSTQISGAIPGSGPNGPNTGYGANNLPGDGGRTSSNNPAPYVMTYSLK